VRHVTPDLGPDVDVHAQTRLECWTVEEDEITLPVVVDLPTPDRHPCPHFSLSPYLLSDFQWLAQDLTTRPTRLSYLNNPLLLVPLTQPAPVWEESGTWNPLRRLDDGTASLVIGGSYSQMDVTRLPRSSLSATAPPHRLPKGALRSFGDSHSRCLVVARLIRELRSD
jgi:hypothetical protein